MKPLLVTAGGAMVLVVAMFVGMLAVPLAVFPWMAGGPGFGAAPIEAPGVPISVSGALPGSANSDVLASARTWLGVPYSFGGCTRAGVDCSCFTELTYAAIGINLPRTAQAQWNATPRVERSALQPGDLVFFAHTYPSVDAITHVGIYIGGGLQLNAPDTGQVVSIQPVFSGFWGAHYAGAGRPRR